MSEIVIIGTGKLNSSLNIYSRDLREATGKERIILAISKEQQSSISHYDDKTEIGYLPKFVGSGWTVNNLFGGLIFHRVRNKLKGKTIHYTTFGLPLISHNDDDIVTLHDMIFLDPIDEHYRKAFNLTKHLLDRFLNFDHVTTPSEFVKNQIIEYGFTGKIDAIYHPVAKEFKFMKDKKAIRKQLRLPDNKVLILSISTNLKRKNLGTVKAAVESMGSDYRLVRVGQKIGDSITFSNLNTEELNLIYNACDLLLFPTLAEGMGKPVVEAFAAGLPTVTSNIEVMREICGEAALIVEPTVEGCVNGIKEILASVDEFSKKGIERAELFSREKFAKKMNDYYEKIETG